MKKQISIYSNFNTLNFLQQLLPSYEICFKTIADLKKENIENPIIIILKKEKEGINFNIFTKNSLIITNDSQIKKSKDYSITSRSFFTPKEIKDHIEKFILNNEVNFNNIIISNKKLINILNKKFCFLTDIENEILLYLVKTKICSKQYIKKNILNIKPSIQTNSVDSHLTRIRKKLLKIQSNLNIQSKVDKISIIIN